MDDSDEQAIVDWNEDDENTQSNKEQKWEGFKTVLNETAKTALGHKERKELN